MLTTHDLTFSYDGQSELRFPDLRCQAGEYWLLLGQSGSGKTTFLHLLAGLLRPHSGEVAIGSTLVNQLPAGRLDRFRGKHVGIIFQKPHFVESLNVTENLALAQHLAGLQVDKERIHTLLERLNLASKAHRYTYRLSQGEQQRVAVARAIINQSEVILADEPTSALDDLHTAEVVSLLEEQATGVGATLLVVTHDNRLRQKFQHQILLSHS